MTFHELKRNVTEALASADIESAVFDAECIVEMCSGFSREKLFLNSKMTAGDEIVKQVMEKTELRATGYPLQYLLGRWEFYSREFEVGPGVLIPRPETELLVDICSKLINQKKNNQIIFDLCAGSGCIGITIADLFPQCEVYLFEKSEKAFQYLVKNVKKHGCSNAKAVLYDVFANFTSLQLPEPDIILSNPPYVRSGEMTSLQREVKFEPVEALDAGADGLMFYKYFAKHWAFSLKPGGVMILECGDDQAAEIIKLFDEKHFFTETVADFNKILRAIKIERKA